MEVRFDRCRVNFATREVFLDHQPRPVQKRVFDVLAYLIQNRHRVISRNELLKEVWLGRIVSNNVFTRTVMQVRTVVGDDDPEAPIIKTVQGIGYRFVANVSETGSEPLPAALPLRFDRDDRRIGFLPFANQTGDRTLAWVELGLMSLVVQALSGDQRLSLVSTASTLMCVEHAPSGLTPEQLAKRLSSMLGAGLVISAVITQREGEFVLTYRSFGAAATVLEGALNGPELTQLALRLARLVGDWLFPVDRRALDEQSADHFVNQCFSRAMQASDRQDWVMAAKYFDLIQLFPPVTAAARLEYAYVLARLADAKSIKMALAVAEEARNNADHIVEARALYVAALGSMFALDDTAGALRWVEQSLALTGELKGEEWRIRALLLQSVLGYATSNLDLAKRANLAGLKACEVDGNQIWRLVVESNEYNMNRRNLSPRELKTATRDLAQRANALEQPMPAANALLTLMHADEQLGELDELLEHQTEFVRVYSQLPFPAANLRTGALRTLKVLAELRCPSDVQHLQEQLEAKPWPSANAVFEAIRMFTKGLHAQAQGHLLEACSCMTAAQQSISDEKFYSYLSRMVPYLIIAELRAGLEHEAKAHLQFLGQIDAYARDADIREEMLLVQCLLAWRAGRASHRAQLEAALLAAPAGFVAALIRVDLAYALLQEEHMKDAEQLLAPIAQWVRHHPSGMATQALWAYLAGDFQQALATHRRHLEVVGGPECTVFAAFTAPYESAAKKNQRQALPILDACPSAYFPRG